MEHLVIHAVVKAIKGVHQIVIKRVLAVLAIIECLVAIEGDHRIAIVVIKGVHVVEGCIRGRDNP